MSKCRVISFVIGRECLLWPMNSLGKALLAFDLLHFVLKVKHDYYSRYLLTSYFCIPVPYDEKDIFYFISLILVPEGLVCLHRTIKLQLFQHLWLRHRLALLWCWMVCFGNEQRSFGHFGDCAQKLHIWLFCWLWGLLGLLLDSSEDYYFFYGILATVVDIMVIWIRFTHSGPF